MWSLILKFDGPRTCLSRCVTRCSKMSYFIDFNVSPLLRTLHKSGVFLVLVVSFIISFLVYHGSCNRSAMIVTAAQAQILRNPYCAANTQMDPKLQRLRRRYSDCTQIMT